MGGEAEVGGGGLGCLFNLWGRGRYLCFVLCFVVLVGVWRVLS